MTASRRRHRAACETVTPAARDRRQRACPAGGLRRRVGREKRRGEGDGETAEEVGEGCGERLVRAAQAGGRSATGRRGGRPAGGNEPTRAGAATCARTARDRPWCADPESVFRPLAPVVRREVCARPGPRSQGRRRHVPLLYHEGQPSSYQSVTGMCGPPSLPRAHTRAATLAKGSAHRGATQ